MEPAIAVSLNVQLERNVLTDNALKSNQLTLSIHVGLLNVVMEQSVKMENVLLKLLINAHG